MTRSEIQENAAVLLEEKRRLVCQWATGIGKSGVVLKFLQRHPDSKTLIVVPEQNNISNWVSEFIKFDVPYDNVEIICYASLHKYKHTFWDLLVYDEVPHIDTDKRKLICSTIDGKYVLALGAVIDDEERDSLESLYGKFWYSFFTLESAIEKGILPPPEVIVLYMDMDDSVPEFRYKGKLLTARGYYEVLKNKVSLAVQTYELNASKFNKIRMLSAGNERKRFLGQQKEKAIKKICNNLEGRNRRFLCFCSSIEQAEILGGEHAFTSKTPASAKVLDRFNNHEIDSLYVVGKLIEGQSLNDIHCGVIGQLGGTHRITVQEVGRILRSINPKIYIPIFKDTKDESFLYTVTNNIPKDYIKYYKF